MSRRRCRPSSSAEPPNPVSVASRPRKTGLFALPPQTLNRNAVACIAALPTVADLIAAIQRFIGTRGSPAMSTPQQGDTPTPWRISETYVRLGVGMARKPSGGRPSKGDRDVIVTRPARPLGNVVRARADEAGMTISEYVAMVLARAHGMPEFAPAPSATTEQGVLPLGKTA